MTADPSPPVAYVVDVCMTCGRLAQWPFCEHRPEGYRPTAQPWTMAVRMMPRSGDRQRLAAAMRHNARRRPE